MQKNILSDGKINDVILYQDSSIIILNKPAHIPVHAGPKGGENLEQYLPALQGDNSFTPALCHRLDRDTAGCLIIGRHQKAMKKMGKLFRDNQVDKTYWAVVEGHVKDDTGTINLPLSKRSKDKRSWWMKVNHENGKEAITDYKVLGRGDNMTWLELKPQTGRTHQLRVHTHAINHSIIGDTIYGNGPKHSPVPTLHLLARQVSFQYQDSKDTINVTSPPPTHMIENLKACGWKTD